MNDKEKRADDRVVKGFIFKEAQKVAKDTTDDSRWFYRKQTQMWYCIDEKNKNYERGIPNEKFIKITAFEAMADQATKSILIRFEEEIEDKR